MSNIPDYNANNMSSDLRPEHHTHDSAEPLPGATGGILGPDYSAENANSGAGFGGTQRQDRLGEFGSSAPETAPGIQDRPAQVNFGGHMKDYDPSANDFAASAHGRGEMFSSGEMGTEPRTQGGVGGGWREREHEPASTATSTAKPGIGDKVTGGAQKYVGKMMNNPDLQEKGELRETGGKPAISGSKSTGA